MKVHDLFSRFLPIPAFSTLNHGERRYAHMMEKEEFSRGKSKFTNPIDSIYCEINIQHYMKNEGNVVSISGPVKILKNKINLKVSLVVRERLKMKIEDVNGLPVYLRQFALRTPETEAGEIEINIAEWEKGKYKIVFVCIATGQSVAESEFLIN